MSKHIAKEHTLQSEEIIQAAFANGQAALSEYESKLFLSQFGISVTREFLAPDLRTTVDAARLIGYPVALKACGPQLMHKSDQGLVELNLSNENEVKHAYDKLKKDAGDALEGMLVTQMVTGTRELMVGLKRDPQFGPLIMLGLGGVMAEIHNDTVFRMAPICPVEAGDMIDQLRSKKMLEDFRGQQPADLNAIHRALIGVGQIGMQFSQIDEIDINPLIISPDGRLTAVDALVILKEANR